MSVFGRTAILLSACLLSSCVTQGTRQSLSVDPSPELSVVHVSGVLTRVPENSEWPESIKLGTRFDYWAVIDNRVKDAVADPRRGSYSSSKWPARYDLKVGDIRFNSDRVGRAQVNVLVQDDNGPNDDGYNITPGYHTSLPEAPGLHAVSFHVGLKTGRRDLVTSDKLPIRAMKIADLNGGLAPNFRGSAIARSDDRDQTIEGKADTFEVFHATKDTPLMPLPR